MADEAGLDRSMNKSSALGPLIFRDEKPRDRVGKHSNLRGHTGEFLAIRVSEYLGQRRSIRGFIQLVIKGDAYIPEHVFKVDTLQAAVIENIREHAGDRYHFLLFSHDLPDR